MRLILVLLSLAAFAQQPSAPTPESRRLFAEIEPVLSTLSEITGWRVKRPIRADFISRSELQSFVEKRLREAVKPEEIRVESLTLKMFGLVPDDFDLAKTTVDLVTEQAAAFYDYNRKRLFITENSSSFLEQRTVLAHELAHALADQQFSLKKYIHQRGLTDDATTAREAVMEGQATWLMWAYSSKIAGADPQPSQSVLDAMRAPRSAAQFPVFDSAPLYIRESLTFPYNQGILFQHAAWERHGKGAFGRVFRVPPASSAEIIHPERYPAPKGARLDPPALPKGYRKLDDGTLGEFDIRVLLDQYAKDQSAGQLALFCKNGYFQLGEHRKTKKPALTWITRWETPESAAEWFGHVRRILEGKSRDLDWTARTETGLEGRNHRGRFVVRLEGDTVTATEGHPD